jgi:hypothetical protein
MNAKLPKTLALILLTIHAAFAQIDLCREEIQKSEILYDMCIKLDPQSPGYMDCVTLYMEQRNKASDACKAAAPEPAPAPQPAPALAPAAAAPAPVAALQQPASLAQALRGSGLSGRCVNDFANVLGKDGFSMGNFIKELPPAVAKVKLQMKSPFGKPKDGDRTDVGLTVGCIKALPESPAEIQGLLKNISLKIGLDLAADAVANLAENSIPANAAKESGSGGGALKTAMSVGLIAGGLSAVVYGLMQNSEVSNSVSDRNGKKAVEAEESRNIGYGVGAALLAGGLGVVIFF